MGSGVTIRRRDGGPPLYEAPAAPLREETPAQALGRALEAAVAQGIDLAGAELRDVDARGRRLVGARLAGAELTGAEIDGADLTRADLGDCLALRLSARGAVLTEAVLRDGHFWAACFEGASLEGVAAEQANFDDANLAGAVLRGGDLTGAGLQRADLRGADFREARLVGADLTDSTTTGARFEGADLSGSTIAAEGRPRRGPVNAAFGWRRRWLLGAAPGSAFMAAFAGWIGWQVATGEIGSLDAGRRIIFAAMLGAFCLLLTAVALTYLLALFDRRPVVTLDAAGIHDRRLTRRPLPWTALRSVGPMQVNGQWGLALEVERPGRFPLARHPLWAVSRLSSRLLRRPELVIRMTGLDAEAQTVLDALQAAAPEPQSP